MPTRRRLSRSPLSAIVVLAALALLVLAAAPAGYAEGEGQTGRAARLFDIAKPAVVYVHVNYRIHIVVPEGTFSVEKQNLLRQRLIAKVQSGEVEADDESLRQAAANEILDNVFDYLEPSSTERTFDETVSAGGSGFFITPDGYLITNAHVVLEDEEGLRRYLVLSVLEELIKQDVQAFAESFGSMDQALVKKLVQAAENWYAHYMKFGDLDKEFLVLPGVAVSGEDAAKKGLAAEVVKAGAVFPGKDVAVLKVQGQNFPTLPLGDDKAIRVGHQVHAIGYPGVATFRPYLKQSKPIEPTLTRGVISARKQMEGGWDVLQTDAPVAHGNSGGPALDDAGRVIGLVTYGEAETRELESGEVIAQSGAELNFLVPTSVVQEFVTQAGVKPSEGQVTKLLRKAVDKMEMVHYKLALRYLNNIKSLAPETPWIDSYISTAQSEIAAGKDKSWQAWVLPLVIIAVVIIAVVALAVVLVTRSGRRGKAPPVLPGYTVGGPAAPMPPVGQPLPPAQAPPPQPAPPQAPPPQAPPPPTPRPPVPPPPPPPPRLG